MSNKIITYNGIIATIVILLFTTSCSTNKKVIIKDYLSQCNNYDFENASSLLDVSYQELFINGDVEIKDLTQLKDFFEWRQLMESKTKILSITSNKDTVITTEETYNLMDQILKRKPRTFKISYILNKDKILKSLIDTIPGYAETAAFNTYKFNEFKKYCIDNRLEFGTGMTRNGALILKKTLITYKNNNQQSDETR